MQWLQFKTNGTFAFTTLHLVKDNKSVCPAAVNAVDGKAFAGTIFSPVSVCPDCYKVQQIKK